MYYCNTRFGNLANFEDFDKTVRIGHHLGVPMCSHQFLRVQSRIKMRLYPARQWTLMFTGVSCISAAEILLWNWKILRRIVGFSSDFTTLQEVTTILWHKRTAINPLITPYCTPSTFECNSKRGFPISIDWDCQGYGPWFHCLPAAMPVPRLTTCWSRASGWPRSWCFSYQQGHRSGDTLG